VVGSKGALDGIGPHQSAITVENLSCSFGGLQAVNGANLVAAPGTFLGLIGPNGAGKTTLIDCISGFNRTYRGTVKFLGHDITHSSPDDVARTGLVRTFQRPQLFGRLTVLSNLMASPLHQRGESIVRAIVGGWRSEERELLDRAWEVLEYFNLERVAQNYCSELSGGQERLVELARIMMFRPKAILLDEPFAGVSPTNRKLLGERLRTMSRERGITIVMVEHRLQMVEELCDSIAFMANGRVIAEGSLLELRQMREVVDSYLGESL
jgi:branched-chain amino acid transport system ATP-binding protein